MPVTLQVLGVSPGIAMAPVRLLERREPVDPARKAFDPTAERARLTEALARTLDELAALRDHAARTLGQPQSEIFDAHRAMASDPDLGSLIEGHLSDGWDASTAVFRACQEFIELLAGLEEEGQRSRADDLRDVRRRLLGHLEGRCAETRSSGTKLPYILVADDLTPSETICLDLSCVRGFLTAAGSRTSHASILARSLGLPAATGAASVLAQAVDGQMVAFDGATGEVVLDPGPLDRERFERARVRAEALRLQREKFAGLPTRTRDGSHVDLAANIGRVDDLNAVVSFGAEGVGLFRTEFLFLDRDRTPTEDEQTAVYQHVLERMAGKPVVIRTIDIGGDKNLPYLPQPAELNPFLGVRAVRLCFDRPDLFRTQIRALLRASPAGDLRVMVPMVALVEEVQKVRAMFAEESAALAVRGIPMGRYQLGIMVEIPAAALNVAALAAEADFFSLGTNDLIQYTMAADRMNDRLTHLYQPLHPSILRLIDLTVQGARPLGRWVGVCGEMASDPEAALLLVGLGVGELSLSAAGIPGLRALFSRVDRARAAETARLALTLGTSTEVQSLVRARHPELTETLPGDPS